MSHYKPNKLPLNCKNIAEIRDEIDAIDSEIMQLFGLRYKYVKEVVKYKEKTADSIIAAKRRDEVIEKRRQWATQNGLDPDVFEKIYRLLIEHFIEEEMKIVNIKPIK